MPELPASFLPSLLVGGSLVYAMFHLILAAGIVSSPPVQTARRGTVSVIIAARNEGATIDALLRSLMAQSSSPDEIIVVDDRSTDATPAILASWCDREPRIRTVRVDTVDEGSAPKKHALARGIAASNGEILLFTDADCVVPPAWVDLMTAAFAPHVGVVIGTYVPQPGPVKHRFLAAFLRYERFRLMVLGHASARVGFPWLASGASFGYRRSVYDETGGFSGLHRSLSGDDDLFVQKVRSHTGWRVASVTDRRACVLTTMPATLREFFVQRTRHMAAGTRYRTNVQALLAAYHASNFVSLAALPAFAVWGVPGSLMAYAIKVCADIILFTAGDKALQRPRDWSLFVPLEFVHAAYLLAVAPVGFFGRIRWKN